MGPEAPRPSPGRAIRPFPDQPRGFLEDYGWHRLPPETRISALTKPDPEPMPVRALPPENDSEAGSLGARRQDIYMSVQRSGQGSLVTKFTIANTKGDMGQGKPRSRIGAKGSGQARLLTAVRGGHCRILRVRYARSHRAS